MGWNVTKEATDSNSRGNNPSRVLSLKTTQGLGLFGIMETKYRSAPSSVSPQEEEEERGVGLLGELFLEANLPLASSLSPPRNAGRVSRARLKWF